MRGIIKDLIDKVEANAKAEAETRSHFVMRKWGRQLVSVRTASISEKTAERNKLLGEMNALTEESAEAHKAWNEATELRKEEELKALAAAKKAVTDNTGGALDQQHSCS